MTVALGDTGITEQYKYFVCHDHASCIMHHASCIMHHACFMILDIIGMFEMCVCFLGQIDDSDFYGAQNSYTLIYFFNIQYP